MAKYRSSTKMQPRQFTLLLAIAFSSSFATGQGAEYGQPCSRTIPCVSSDPLDPLRCSSQIGNGICVCETDMFRHSVLNRCVSPQDGSCTICAEVDVPIRTCTSFADCSRPSDSDDPVAKTGICHCEMDTVYDPDDGQCKLPQGSGRCSADTDCATSLKCVESQCVCPEGQAYQNGRCRILAGGSCNTVEPLCTENAICDNNICKCPDPNFRRGEEDGLCVGSYGASCDNATSPCSAEDLLTCSGEGICSCKDKYEADNENKLCKGHIGQPCRDGRNQDCIVNSICSSAVCSCPERFEASGEMECVALHGVPCSDTVKCSSSRFLSCNDATKLCDCSDPANQLYEGGDTDACVGKAGAQCMQDAEGIACVIDSTCLTTAPRMCYCNPGFVDAEGGVCILREATTTEDPAPEPVPVPPVASIL